MYGTHKSLLAFEISSLCARVHGRYIKLKVLSFKGLVYVFFSVKTTFWSFPRDVGPSKNCRVTEKRKLCSQNRSQFLFIQIFFCLCLLAQIIQAQTFVELLQVIYF